MASQPSQRDHPSRRGADQAHHQVGTPNATSTPMPATASKPAAQEYSLSADSYSSAQHGEGPRQRTRSFTESLGAIRRNLQPWMLLLVLIILIAVFSIALPSTFPTVANFQAIVSGQSVELVLALGLTLVLRTDDFDLSIGASAGLTSGLIAVLATHQHLSLGICIVIGLAAAAVVGIVNGVLVVMMELDGFVTTLATMTLVTGLTYGVMNNETIGPVSGSLTAPFSGNFGPFPSAAVYSWILAAVLWFIYRYRPIGRKLLFIGGNRQAARLIGLRVTRIRFSAFVLCALFAGLAGLMFLGQIGQADPADGAQLLLPPYSAAFLGATAVQVGRINVVGTVIALYVLIVGVTGLELAGAPTWIGQVFNGAALAFAVGLSRLARARLKRRDLRATA